MCSSIGYKFQSCIIVQFSGFKLVNENTTGQTYSEPDVGMRVTAKKKIQRNGPDYRS